MAQHTGYCRGCNLTATVAGSLRCPQCGQELASDPDPTTLDWEATVAGKDHRPPIAEQDDPARHLLGSTLFLYTLEEFLGRGTTAWVFRARHNMLHRLCALKLLSPEFQQRQPTSVTMFLAEARAAASLVHPHIVAVHNLGEVEGRHFIEMEYVPGESLQRLVTTQTRLPPLDATRYMVQSCSALAAAHQQGLVHRDFKPANILVRHDGIAKLADFGLARPVTADAAASEGGLAGTPYFMAPELFQGRPGSMAGDVYAAGISFYYLLTGQFPFAGKHLMQIGQLHAQQPIPDPRELVPAIPGAAVEILRRALAKQPEERYPSGRELHLELQNLFTTLKDLPSLVSEAIQQLDASSRQQDRRIAIVVRMPRGRTQTVFVEEIAADPWPTALVRIYSICGPAEPSYFRRALELNASVPHGALAIEPIDGVPHFVMLHCYPRTTCDAVTISHSVRDIAHWADEVEFILTGRDRF